MKWVSKAPSKKTSATNLLRIFDKTSWILTFASMLVVSCSLIAAYKLGHISGGKKPDIVLLILTPLAMFNAEAMPVDVEQVTRRKSRGEFTRNFLFLNWSVMGMILVFCFLCNLRAMILKPTLEKPMDSTQDLFLQGKTPIIISGLYTHYMETSINQWHRKAREIAHVIPNPSYIKESLETLVQQDGTHSLMAPPPEIAYSLKNQKNSPAIHFSQEDIDPYYVGWVTAKQSPWKAILDYHVGIIQQASYPLWQK